jgi:Ca-activated chloride channel family protein
MGSGHRVTAFYELVPLKDGEPDTPSPGTGGTPPVDPLVFQQSTVIPSEDLLVFKLRYKKPGDGNESSILISERLSGKDMFKPLEEQGDDYRFASAVVEFGMLLRDSPYKGTSSWQSAMERARQSKGKDYEGYRAEFVKLVEMAELLSKK